MNEFPAAAPIRIRIHLVRGHRVMLHTDLARLYGVPTNRLLRHAQRFPGEFCFLLERSEVLNCTDEPADGRQLAYGFTEHGALAVAYALDTPKAVAMGIDVVRAFVQLRQARASQTYANHSRYPLDLAAGHRLASDRRSIESLALTETHASDMEVDTHQIAGIATVREIESAENYSSIGVRDPAIPLAAALI